MPLSWEMATGPTVAYNVADQGSTCVAVEGPKGSNFSNFRVQGSSCVAVEGPKGSNFSNYREALKGANYRFASSHDTVMGGLSALSLHGQYQLDSDSTAEDSQSVHLGALCCASLDSHRCMSLTNDETLPFSLAPLGVGSPACNVDFVHRKEIHSQVSCDERRSDNLLYKSIHHRTALCSSAYNTHMPNGSHCANEGNLQEISCSYRNTFKSGNIPENRMRMDDCTLDTISELSFSSENGMPVASTSSGELSQGSDVTEVQSALKEGGDTACSVGSSLSARKGLSRFYSGKSRSFSCLGDVVSVKDLAKPESGKKRKVMSGRSRLPPLQKGSVAISKKPLQSGKLALALAVTMSTKEVNEPHISYATPMCQKSLVPSRSYSLSDLQGAAGSRFFIGRDRVNDGYA